MLRTTFMTAAIVALVVLAACGSTPPGATTTASTTSPGPGWRKGLVVQAGDRDSLGPPIDSDCRERARTDGGHDAGDAPHRYAEIQYFVGRHAHLRIVPIDDALEVAAGDAVWFRSFGCALARPATPARSRGREGPPPSTGVAQPRRESVDRQMDAVDDPRAARLAVGA